VSSSSDFNIDRTAFSVVLLSEADNDKAYWLSKTPRERLRAMELIRQTIYGYTPTTARFQRVFEVAQRESK
jgi:hypothetical protein